MSVAQAKNLKKIARKRRVRAKIIGTATRPRLSVFRGNSTCYLQLIDDERGLTLVSAAETEFSAQQKKLTKMERAKMLGEMLAEKAKGKGIASVVFDRGGNRYHGRVQAIAEGAREKGLEF